MNTADSHRFRKRVDWGKHNCPLPTPVEMKSRLKTRKQRKPFLGSTYERKAYTVGNEFLPLTCRNIFVGVLLSDDYLFLALTTFAFSLKTTFRLIRDLFGRALFAVTQALTVSSTQKIIKSTFSDPLLFMTEVYSFICRKLIIINYSGIEIVNNVRYWLRRGGTSSLRLIIRSC